MKENTSFVKKPCKHCPFRNDIRPYLHPDRAADIAYASENPYSDFPCHKTTEHDEYGKHIPSNKNKTCAGFLTMRAQCGERIPQGFEPSWYIIYESPLDMFQAYDEEWKK